MKNLFYLLFLICFNLHGQTDEYNYWILEQRLPDWTKKAMTDQNITNKYKISDYINPFYLQADFNGDDNLDIALTIVQKNTGKKGILIIHKDNKDYFIFGAGNEFGNGGDNFDWMDIWRIHYELNAHELTYKENGDIDNSTELELKNPGLDVVKSESASGLIYWDGEKYKWAQTRD